MGLVTQKEAELAADAARNVDGATRVVKLFEYID
jgi:osmotically-inducible protein OsmY